MLFVLFLLLLFVCFQVASPQVIAREGEGARGLKQAHVGSEAFSNSGKRPKVSRLFHYFILALVNPVALLQSKHYT